MPKAATLTLKEKYELLRKKQAEKTIAKKPQTLSTEATNRLAEQLAKKKQNEREAKANKETSGFKLPATLQRALQQDPEIFQKQPILPPNSESKSKGRRNGSTSDDEEFFVKRARPRAENKIFIDDQGQEFFTCTVFVGDISQNAKGYHLEEAFRPFGHIVSARIINEKPYGFVKYRYEEDAKRAIVEMNGFLLCGTPIRVSKAKVPSHKSHYRTNRNFQHDRSSLDILPDRDAAAPIEDATPREDYGHLGEDDSISNRTQICYEDV